MTPAWIIKFYKQKSISQIKKKVYWEVRERLDEKIFIFDG